MKIARNILLNILLLVGGVVVMWIYIFILFAQHIDPFSPSGLEGLAQLFQEGRWDVLLPFLLPVAMVGVGVVNVTRAAIAKLKRKH